MLIIRAEMLYSSLTMIMGLISFLLLLLLKSIIMGGWEKETKLSFTH